eukprot:TRINITY_DN15393_c0_g1_i2.p1 TRINITY_DN15393_c0_g1~~TRINITY_DN15393_c0_g1_i2.p1  ORF type:complete len:260 (-),score=80.79 TRINITY_DN15393_c0_g1_i2:229-1008(-)
MLGLNREDLMKQDEAAQKESVRSRSPFGKKGQAKRGGAAASTGGAKKELATNEDVTELVELTSRLALSTTSKTEHALGMLLEVLLVKEDNLKDKEGASLMKKVKAANRKYQDEAQQAKMKALMGPPHIKAWEAVVEWASGLEDTTGGLSEAVAKHTEEVTKLPAQLRAPYLSLAVKFVRVKPCGHQKGMMKLEMKIDRAAECATAEALWRELRAHLILRRGADFRAGRAPPGPLQRQLVSKMKSMGVLKDREDQNAMDD